MEVPLVELRQVDLKDLAKRGEQVAPARARLAYEEDVIPRQNLNVVESAEIVDGATQDTHERLRTEHLVVAILAFAERCGGVTAVQHPASARRSRTGTVTSIPRSFEA